MITLESQPVHGQARRSTMEEVVPSHVSMLTHPKAVTKLVETAAGATT